MDVDELFRTANLPKLVDSNKTVSLYAQVDQRNKSTDKINDLEQFFAYSVLYPPQAEPQTIITQLDKDQSTLKKAMFKGAWVGVEQFSQAEIPHLSLQSGLEKIKICMKKKGTPLPNEITAVIIYKTLTTSQIIYDYLFYYSKNNCQEALYNTQTGQCDLGMKRNCYHNFGL